MKSLKRIRKRRGRCYELAVLVMLREEHADEFRLIHGTVLELPISIVPYSRRIDHAWIELPDGCVYDPVLNVYAPSAAYVEQRRVVVERVYARMEAMNQYCDAGHAGPWHK